MALTNQDIKFIRYEIDEAKKEIKEEIHNEISHLPTKDEFFERMDFICGELKAIREEQPVLSHRASIHGDQIQKIATHLHLAI